MRRFGERVWTSGERKGGGGEQKISRCLSVAVCVLFFDWEIFRFWFLFMMFDFSFLDSDLWFRFLISSFSFLLKTRNRLPSMTFLVIWFLTFRKRIGHKAPSLYGPDYKVQHHFVPLPRHWFSGTKCGQFLRQYTLLGAQLLSEHTLFSSSHAESEHGAGSTLFSCTKVGAGSLRPPIFFSFESTTF